MQAPGFGNPLELRIDDFDDALRFVAKARREENAAVEAGSSHRARVEADMRNLS